MKRIFLLTVLLLTMSLPVFPQMVGMLEDDARIIKGALPNGLSYYIVENHTVDGYADFSFVQKGGMAMEDSSTMGMTRLMECMALTETANFPDGSIFSFVDNMGLSRKDGLVIKAGDYYTSYTFNNVPVKKNDSMVDSMLLAMYNMSSALLVSDRSVERGKNFLKNVYASTQTLENRIEDSLARYYYAGTVFAPLAPEEFVRRIDGYSTEDVAAFYRLRCRPDMQAVVIAGDVDPKAVESKIRALFQVVPRPAVPMPEFSRPVMRSAGGDWFYFRDEEADRAAVSVCFMTEDLDSSLKNTAIPFVYNYISDVGMDIMRRRLESALEDAGFYAVSVGADRTRYLNKNAYRFYVECAPEDYTDAYVLILNEIERLLLYGVSEAEFCRSSGDFIAALDDTYNRRSYLDNGYYIDLCSSNFTDGYVMAGIELYRSYIGEASEVVDSSTVYGFLSSVLSDTAGRIVVCSSPEYSGGLEYFAARPSPTVGESLSPVVERRPVPGALLTRKSFVNQSTGVVSMRLPNGAVLAYRKMERERGWVYFEAVARGGVSLSGDSAALLRRYIDDVARISVNGGLNMFDLQRLCVADRITVGRSVSVADRRIYGKFPSDRMDDFMKLVSVYFDGSSPDYATFERFVRMEEGCAPYAANSPEKVSAGIGSGYVRASGPAGQEDALRISDLDYDAALAFVNTLFSNAAEFAFIFVGDFDEGKLLKSVNDNLSGLPGRRVSGVRNALGNFYIPSYDEVVEEEVGMVFPRRLHTCRLTFPSEMNTTARMLSAVTAKVIEREVIRRLSLHGILADADRRFYRYPEEVLVIEFTFCTYEDPGNLEELFADIIMDLADRGVSQGEVDGIKRNMGLKDSFMESEDYGYWISILRDRYIKRKDFYTGRTAALEAVTADQVEEELLRVLEDGRISIRSVVPEE
ncbi:MAG TPA: insulinase family protein [Candidatus Coprenecus pullistercoris]|nr:insulinase family protein [Candidatus Coprenecus pullistercoris]